MRQRATWRLRFALACRLCPLAAAIAAAWLPGPARGADAAAPPRRAATQALPSRRAAAAMLLGYFEQMCRPKPFKVRTGEDFAAHRRALRQKLLACAGLWPLPKRPPLDAHESPPVDHEWCTVRRVSYQLFPKVYSTGLLYMPKRFVERPAPAVLCPHGHWPNGSAHPEVQTRCLVLARMGYVVFSPSQNHYEDPALGISHQTLMIWNNVRALDWLEGLGEVDGKRIGCTGCSGGGLQTQMILAVDRRVRAASIAGMTCDYREIVFPGRAHCGCNHFPGIMRHTDEPEISALGLPTPVQYLTMNDWTRRFEKGSFPTIRRLYEANGAAGRTDCKHWPTPHSYDKPKRQRMYGWMEKWLRGKDRAEPPSEPETKTLPVQTLKDLKAPMPGHKGFAHISRLYSQRLRRVPLEIRSRQGWQAYRRTMRSALRDLLGEALPPRASAARLIGTERRDGLVIERVLCPSEAGIRIPAIVVRPAASAGRLPAVVICDDRGKGELLAEPGAGSAVDLARKGRLVVLPDVRFVGELSLRAIAGLGKELLTFRACSPLSEGKPEGLAAVWERNAMLWGRPVPGMAASDIRAVLDCLAAREDAKAGAVTLIGRGRSAIAALFAAALDDRVTAVEADLAGRCFEKRDLPLVPFVLTRGDVLQWAAVLADRRVTLKGVPPEAGDPRWVKRAFKAAGHPGGLRLVPRR